MALTYNGEIKDERINKLIKECLNITREVFPEIDDNYNWILWGKGTKCSNTYGTCRWPQSEYGDFQILLNEMILTAEDDYIKRTILHELAHYVENCREIQDGIVWWSEDYDGWRVKRGTLRSGEFRSHGSRWREVADALEKASGLKINRTDSMDDFKDMKDTVSKRKKYMFQCKHCKQPFGYERETSFVRTFDKICSDGKPKWRCPKCHSGYNVGDQPPFEKIN